MMAARFGHSTSTRVGSPVWPSARGTTHDLPAGFGRSFRAAGLVLDTRFNGAKPPQRSCTACQGFTPRGRPGALKRAAHGSHSSQARRQPAFTLIEMVVVVAIVLVVLGLVLPAASTLWNERKRAEAENAIQGLLTTTRAEAMRVDGVESGFFAFVDDSGVQHFVSIAEASPSEEELADLDALQRAELRRAYAMVFQITDDRANTLPAPMRTAPRKVVEQREQGDNSFDFWSDPELANNDFNNPPEDLTQRHRNFFTIVFSTDGHLLVDRDVLILDEDQDADGRGDRTGLSVGLGPPEPPEQYVVKEYYGRSDGEKIPIDGEDGRTTFPFLVIDDDEVAVNFPAVDGLLVYDDSVFRELPTEEKRQFMLRKAQPLYISRWTGTVVRGAVDERVPDE